MKPVLVLALGNSLAGDDAVGGLLADRLVTDAEVMREADVVCGGTDVYRCDAVLAGRTRVVIVDAALTDDADLFVRTMPHPLPTEWRRSHAHALDPAAAISLLRALQPEIGAADIWWILVDVPGIALGPGLSAAVEGHLHEALEAVRRLVLDQVLPTRSTGTRAAH